MQTFAILDAGSAKVLSELLEREGIVCQSRTVEDENGLEAVELQVQEAQFDRACDLAEQQQAAASEEAQKNPKQRCVACKSANVEYIEDLKGVKTITKIAAVYLCHDCGHVVAVK